MNEEKIGMYTAEEIYEELANGFLHHSMVDAMYFKIKDLQQKVEKLEKENETLNSVLETLKETNSLLINQKYKLEYELDTLDNKYEQLENIRKEAIAFVKNNKDKTIAPYGDDEDTDYEVCLFEDDINDLLNILNKGSDK